MSATPSGSEAAGRPKREYYAELVEKAAALLDGENNAVANAANVSALAWELVPQINWCGFYLADAQRPGQLVLGPFHGRPACVRIALGRGVCGTAAQARQTQLVPDVDEFPGHIRCDGASRSEVVVPVVGADGALLGVWDVDSPVLARFDEEDRAGMEALVAVYVRSLSQQLNAAKLH
eukprot:m51a1_g8660 hypothetical protein (178) ;mRNA; f:79286-79819